MITFPLKEYIRVSAGHDICKKSPMQSCTLYEDFTEVLIEKEGRTLYILGI